MNKRKEDIMKEINDIREYPIPSETSLTVSDWLNTIKENRDINNKTIIKANTFLSSILNSGYIKKNPNGCGYIPTKKFIKKDLFEIKENYRTSSSNNELVQTCTIMLTTKGQDLLKPIVTNLINIKKCI